jgi:hypothetical protein
VLDRIFKKFQTEQTVSIKMDAFLPGAAGLDFETWESTDIDEITPYS